MNRLPSLPPIKLTPHVVLITVICFGTFLRLINFESQLSFDFDNEFFAWEAKSILTDTHLTLIGQESSFPGIFIGPLYTYLSTAFYWLTSLDPIGGGLLAIIFGIATTISFYKIGELISSKSLGLLLAAVYQFSLFSIVWDSGASPLNGMLLIPTLWLYTLLQIHKPNFLLLHFLVLSLGLHFHPTSAILILTSIVVLYMWRKIISWSSLPLALLLFVLILSPLIVFEIRHQFLMTHSLFQFLENFESPFSLSPLLVLLNSTTGWIHFPNYLNSWLLSPVLIAIIFLSFVQTKSKVSKQVYFIFFCLFTTTLFSLYVSPRITDYYSMVIYSPVIIVTFLSLTYWFIKFPRFKLILIPFFIVNFFSWLNFKKDYNLSEKKQIVSWIIDHSHGQPFRVSDSLIKPGYNTGYPYLFWLYGAKMDPTSPLIYSLVIPPDYFDITPVFQTKGVRVAVDRLN